MSDPTLPKSPGLYGLYRFLPPSVYGPAPQNPAPFNLHGQVDLDRVKSLADQIVSVFLNSLPSNYVSQVKGPYYVQQFQAAAEELAKIQVLLADAYEDSDYDFTRTEVLYQFLAALVFPDAAKEGLPQIDGDITYRDFLKRMVALLLQGSKTVSLVGGLEALTDANVSVLEKVKHLSDPGTLWTLADQFTFEVDVSNFKRTGPTTAISVATHYHTVTVNVSGSGTTTEVLYDAGTGPAHTHTITDFVVQDGAGTGQAQHTHDLISTFPDLPIVLQRNAALVLQALDPASTLYEYRNLFRENLRGLVTDQVTSMDLSSGYYEDFRHDCSGVKEISGTNGVVGADRFLFHDPTLSFRSVRVGAELVIPVVAPAPGTPRENRYRVTAAVPFPYGDDPIPRAYTTSPTALTGFLTVSAGAFIDTSQNFVLCAEGETLTITSGPNAGTYLLDAATGPNGGPIGNPATLGPSTGVRPVPSYLRVVPRIMTPGTGITYRVSVDHLGVRVPQTVTGEDASWYFFGPAASDTLYTLLGPLVKSWGDATPAQVADVTVRYDGVPVTVSAVNPYTGEITLAASIAPFAPGAHTVTVDYRWFVSPVTGMAGLNTKGLTLNKWSLRRGRNTTTTPTPTSVYGGFYTTPFAMGVTLGRFNRRPPALRIAHRFIGFEKGYTASLNSPTTMLLNQVPGRVSVPYAVADVSPQSFRYEGDAAPTFPWESVGPVIGSFDGGYYTLADNSPAQVAYWKRDFALPTSTTIAMAARFQVATDAPDGVFTGVGFGFHNNRRLFFAGALRVPNPLTGEVLRHIGILLRPGDTSQRSSWTIGPNAAGAVQKVPAGATYGTVSVPTANVPTLLSAGDKFQILDGTQTGVYTVTDLYQSQRTGQTFLVVTPPFPANPELFGNRDVTLYFDTAWDAGLCTWRVYANTRNQSVTVVFGGTSGSTTSVTANTLASPAYLGPDVLPEGYGRALWGSVSRIATNEVTWDFVRVASTPDGGYNYSRGTLIDTKWARGTVTVLTPIPGDTLTIDASPAPILGPTVTLTAGTSFAIGATNVLTAANIAAAINASLLAPNFLEAVSDGIRVTITTNTSGSPGNGILLSTVSGGRLVLSGATLTGVATDPENGDWYLETPFGDTRAAGSTVTITSTAADAGLGTFYGYGYTDPFLNGRRVTAFDAKVSVQRDTAGAGGATLSLRDTHKEARLATLRWIDKGSLGKFVFRTDTVSLVGSTPYWQQGWNGGAGDRAFANGPEQVLRGGDVPWTVFRTLTPYYATDVGRFLEFRLAVESSVPGALGRIGLSLACAFGTVPRAVYLEFRTGGVTLTTAPGAGAIVNVGVPWEDGAARTYRITYNAGTDTVDLHIDGTAGVLGVALGLFSPSALSGSVQVESGLVTGASFTANLRGLCYGGTDEGVAGLGRTFGVYLGGDPQELDSYAVPRTDGLNVPNSDPSSVITPMDWSSECWVRVFLDPTFGVAFIRPDLAPPPGYAGDFATQSMNPSAGWVRIEYAKLPRVDPVERFGDVAFGALNPEGSVLSTWNDVRYRVFTNTSVDYAAPQGMALNRWNVVTSNDFARDVTPEEVVVASVTRLRVSLRPCHIFANRVFAVRVDGVTIPQNLWRFNRDSQEITLTAGLPSEGYPVNVVFAPGRPVTNTYLQSQPFDQSQTILNEGTPTFQESQAGTGVYSTINLDTVSGDGGRAPKFPPAGPSDPEYFLRDQYLVRQATDTEALYERMEFLNLEDGGQRGRISSYCEGGPGAGGTWATTEFALAGAAFTDPYAGMVSPPVGVRPGTYRYSLMASGGGFEDGVLGTYSFTNPTTGVVAPFSGASPVTTGAEPRMLYSVGPSSGVVQGTDDGTAYRETLFVLRTGAAPGTVTVWTGGSPQQTWG
jgi:hypothetical protein